MNRLASETSPYLRQHRDNPVDWFAWGPEAFAEARRRDRPILLSVGYSSCHWCHVMAHESFEDPATAAVMNEGFVNVKVDREERPDVDAIYMEAVQVMTGRGGWPMTVFLTPDGRPFFGGTYYPKERRGQMASFVELLAAIDDAWVNRRAGLEDQAGELTAAIGRLDQLPVAAGLPARELVGEAAGRLVGAHDGRWGGFGPAPKFPHAMGIDFLLRWHVATGSASALTAATDSLDAMAAGGINDHLAGGFARYSTDERWLVPHFEKMLYDNALLTRAYLHAWLVTGEARHLQVLTETIGYVLADLTHPDGGFYSAEDADSEGLEGKFYVWTAAEVRRVGGDACADWYGVTDEGNFDDIPAPDGGWNILSRLSHRGVLERPPEVEAGRVRLLAARSLRVRPGLDDKVLTEWNGLMLSALAEAAFATGRADWLDAAVANGEFLLRSLRRADGRLLRSWQADGGARHLAYAQDHAALVDAFVRLAEATGAQTWLTAATETAEALIALFWDEERGGLFTTGSDAETLITRPKDVMDNATPSAASLAALGLARLAALTGNARYAERADSLLRYVGVLAVRQPQGFGLALCALEAATSPAVEVVIPGHAAGASSDLVDALRGRWLPNAVLAWGQPGTGPLWEGRTAGQAYVCRGSTCGLPADNPAALLAQLGVQA